MTIVCLSRNLGFGVWQMIFLVLSDISFFKSEKSFKGIANNKTHIYLFPEGLKLYELGMVL